MSRDIYTAQAHTHQWKNMKMHGTSVGSGPLALNPGLLVDMLTNGCYSLGLVHCRSPTLRSGSTLIMLQHGVHSIPQVLQPERNLQCIQSKPSLS